MNVKFKLCTIFIYKKNIHLENINSVPENINNYKDVLSLHFFYNNAYLYNIIMLCMFDRRHIIRAQH